MNKQDSNYKAITVLNDDHRESLLITKIKKYLPVKSRELISQLKNGEGYLFKNEFDETKSIFVHVPKAAGTSISKAIYGRRMGHYPIDAYFHANNIKAEKYYKFAFVRNPITRTLSAWNYLQVSPHLEDREWFNKNLASFDSFNEFVINWVNDANVYSWKHFVPQTSYIMIDNHIAVDDVFKTEKIYDSCQILQQKLNTKILLRHQNKSTSHNIDISNEAMAIIRNVYKRDFEFLDYE